VKQSLVGVPGNRLRTVKSRCHWPELLPVLIDKDLVSIGVG